MDRVTTFDTCSWKAALVTRLIERHLQPGMKRGTLTIALPGNLTIELKGDRSGQSAQLTILRWRALGRLVSRGSVGFAEGYLAQDWTTDSLSSLVALIGDNLGSLGKISNGTGLQRVFDLIRHVLNRNTRSGSRRNISFHYDLGNDFYGLWLDETMSYSAADFSRTDSLGPAQQDKYRRLCRTADVSADHHVLEIGCGWGGLLEHLASLGCVATGISVSAEQVAYASARLGISARVHPRLQDYRDVSGTFDRILSIEMFEAVGEAYWDTFAAHLARMLSRDGVAGMQVITIDEAAFDAYRKRPDFIQQHIFPGGMLPTVTHLKEVMSRHGLVVSRLHRFGMDYARTLAHWRERFEAAWPLIAAQGFDARFKRLWMYYLCYCETGFRIGRTDVVQIRIEHQD